MFGDPNTDPQKVFERVGKENQQPQKQQTYGFEQFGISPKSLLSILFVRNPSGCFENLFQKMVTQSPNWMIGRLNMSKISALSNWISTTSFFHKWPFDGPQMEVTFGKLRPFSKVTWIKRGPCCLGHWVQNIHVNRWCLLVSGKIVIWPLFFCTIITLR